MSKLARFADHQPDTVAPIRQIMHDIMATIVRRYPNYDKSPAASDQSRGFPQSSHRIARIAQDVVDDDGIEFGVAERQVVHGALPHRAVG